MGKGRWLLLAAAAIGIPLLAHRGTFAVVAALVLWSAYYISLRVHPRTRHRRCGGTGEHRGSLFAWGHRRCPGCAGGRSIRYGAVWLGSPAIRSQHRRQAAARRRARENRTWR